MRSPGRHRQAIAVAATLVATLAATPCSGGSELRLVALTGQAAPGTDPGVVFAAFESPFNQSFPVPLTDGTEQVLFFAFLEGSGVPPFDHGLWVDRPAGTTLLARVGDPAPGTEPGVVFAGLPNAEVPLGFLPGGGAVAFPAVLTGPGVDSGNDDGIWSDASGVLALVVREDSPVPGLGPDVTFGMPGLHRFTSVREALFFATLRGGGVTDADDETLWSHLEGTFTLRAREGDAAPGTEPGVVFGEGLLGSRPGAFPFADFNDAGGLLLRADLLGPGVDEFNDEALFSDRSGRMEIIVREGDPAPGADPGVTLGGEGVSLNLDYPVMNDLGHVAFTVDLEGSIPATIGLFSDHRGSLELLALPGDPAPGTDGTYTGVGSPALSDAGRIAFKAGIETGPFPPTGIFWDQSGEIEPLVMPGDPIPDREGATLAGTSFIDGFTASGLLAFRAGIDTPNGPASALLVADANGDISTLVVSGDVVDVDGQGDLRTVELLFPGGLEEDGTLPFRLNFTDGTSGLFTAFVPGAVVFADGFESGDTNAWSVTVP